MDKKITTLRALRSVPNVVGRISPTFERRKLHALLDRMLNDVSADGDDVLGFAVVVQVRSPGGDGSFGLTESASRDPAGLIGIVQGLLRDRTELYLASMSASTHGEACGCPLCST